MWKKEKEILSKGKVLHKNERNGAPLLLMPDGIAIKCFPYKGLLMHLVRVFTKSTKAHKQYKSAMRLQELGLKTPHPIGVLQFRGRYNYEGAYLYKYLEKAAPFYEALASGNREKLIGKLADEISIMARADCLFVDFHLGNVLVDAEGDLYWIDPEITHSKATVRKKFWSRVVRMHTKCDPGVLSEHEWNDFVSNLESMLSTYISRYSSKYFE